MVNVETEVEYLDLLRDVVRDYRPPDGLFDPSAHWVHHYDLYTLVNAQKLTLPKPRVGGKLRLERNPQAGGATLKVHYEKNSEYARPHQLVAEVVCAGDDLSTPLHWRSTYLPPSPSRTLRISSEVHEIATANQQGILIAKGKIRKQLPVQAPYTSFWSLFDAVQRLDRKRGNAWRFTLIDAGNIPKPDQVLSFYQNVELKDRWAGAPSLRVHGFLQTGAGISPQVFWVDDRGELLFFISGLDAFVLSPATPATEPHDGGGS